MDYGICLLLDSIIYQSSHGFFANVSTAPRLAPLRSGGVSLSLYSILKQPKLSSIPGHHLPSLFSGAGEDVVCFCPSWLPERAVADTLPACN